MEVESIPVLLVTANVGSVFEDPSRLLNTWINEFVDKVKHIRPQFLALHLQEVGGKTYEKSMEYVEKFIQMLCENLDEYNRIRIYLDEDYNSAEHFTALGNLYFIHHSLKEVKIWNFLTHEWETGDGKSIHTGNIEAIATKEKSKFPQHFFPECKWSRKGFLRTRWELNCTVIDLINIHLFHDASNLAACEEFPSVYCKTRRRALVHTLEKFHIDTKNGFAPFFVFGDFNFRCDTEGVVKKLTEDLTKHRIQSAKNDSTKLQYKNSEGENVLIVGKKEFTHNEHQTKFKESWLQQFDREIEPLREILVEFPITFPPSYPYEEEPELPKSYMSTRCPAWCDRIVMNPNARDLLVDESFSSSDYNVIGENVCMGDHKPVYLSVRVKSLQGIVRCCECYENYSNNLPARKFYSDHKQYILNKNIILSSKSALNSICCLYNNENFYNILLECRNLDDNYKNKLIKSRIDSLKNLHQTKSSLDNNVNSNLPNIINEIDNQQPLISINITDTDNFNICLCTPSISSLSDQKVDDNIDNTICSVCQNIIKYQSNEHRCTLVTKRLMLSNDIIVNRIDTHYLNTTNLDNYLGQEPYTPESAESHSPYPEFDEVEVNNAILNDLNSTTTSNNYQLNNNATTQIKFSHNNYNQSKDFIHMNSSDKIQSNSSNNLNRDFNVIEQSRGVVSPVQLKTRLENLQRASLNNENSSTIAVVEVDKLTQNRFKKCCSIL